MPSGFWRSPIALDRDDLTHLPTVLRDLSYHVVDGESGYLALYRRLTGQQETPAPSLGKPKALVPKARRSAFGLLSRAPSSPDPAETASIAAYRRWAADRYAHLDLVGLAAGDVRLRLEEIYVPLRILERQERIEAEGKRLREQSLGSWQQTLELDRLFLRPGARHGLILGEAGSGKTTALRKLHQLVLETRDATALGLAPETLPVFLRLRRPRARLIEAQPSDVGSPSSCSSSSMLGKLPLSSFGSLRTS